MLKNTFLMTPSVFDMVLQHKRSNDILPGIDGARIRSNVEGKLSKNLEKIENGELDDLLETIILAIRNDFKTLITTTLSIDLVDLSISKEKRKGKFSYFATLTTESGEQLLIDINHFNDHGSFQNKSFLTERPDLCWLLDSRSPFFSKEFQEIMNDIFVLSNIQSSMSTNTSLVGDLYLFIKESLRGEIQ